MSDETERSEVEDSQAAGQDPSQMKLDDLRDMIDSMTPDEADASLRAEQEEFDKRSSEERAVAEEGDSSADEESEDETQETQDEESTAEPNELDLIRLENERLKLEAEKVQHFREAHDRLAGQYGHLKSELERLKRVQGDRRDDSDIEEYSAPEAAPRSSGELDELRQEIRQLRKAEASRAMAEEVSTFQQQYPDFVEYQQEMAEHMKAQADKVNQALDSHDPDRARMVVRDLVRGAYLNARETKLRAMLEEAKKKEADQSEKLKHKKRVESLSGDSGSAPKSKPRKLEDLSDEELKKLVDDPEKMASLL